ncbi:hypothetical protein CEP52_007944 [Fusarium oligoseptatum]|uniref:Uncharacterized protein n=1 Tax=Fusarium oligoseptatum TaxID=2604345 RepID=A0A428TKB3_9HYPO|nr:hypothetical protein CEP52_007944 [Fusarium oligoseptatum]
MKRHHKLQAADPSLILLPDPSVVAPLTPPWILVLLSVPSKRACDFPRLLRLLTSLVVCCCAIFAVLRIAIVKLGILGSAIGLPLFDHVLR